VPDTPTTDDDVLVRRARSGDRAAFGALVRLHQAAALRVAALYAPAGEAEDAVQDGFVKAHRALRRFELGRPFRPWLLAIVVNDARDRARAARRASHLVDRAAALAPPAGVVTPEEDALARIGAGPLAAAVAVLGEDEQRAIVLRHVLDLSEEETAAVLGCAVGTVKSRTSRGLARLRATLGEEAR
jgi:RNA polymerase sigma-70 factor (ECF subfamily)